MKPGQQAFYIVNLQRSYQVTIDSKPEYGWVCVTGLAGTVGSVSVPIEKIKIRNER